VPITVDGQTYPSGSYVIPMDQPKSGLVTTLFERTFYPDNPWTRTENGVPIDPWDMTTDTMPEFMGVVVHPLQVLPGEPLEQVAVPVLPEGGITKRSDGQDFLLSASNNASFAAVNDLLALGAEVMRLPGAFRWEDAVFPAGSFVIKTIGPDIVAKVAASHHVEMFRVQEEALGAVQIQPLRIGIFQRYWGGNADEGWTRLVLEQFRFPYITIQDQDVNVGNLSDRIDVLVIPADTTTYITGDVQTLWEKHIANKPYVLFPPEYQSGINADGIQAIKEFVAAGGRLVAMGQSCSFAIDAFALDVVNVVEGLDTTTFFCPGSTLKAEIDPLHPAGYAMPENTFLVFYASAAFEIPAGAGCAVVARYAQTDVLQSGWLIGEEYLAGKAAVLSVPWGDGEVALIGCRVQNRAQTDGAYKLLFNQFYR
jgi:hypothetical protein